MILNDYQEAYVQAYSDHPLAEVLRNRIPSIVKNLISEPERYIIKGSAGAGKWTSTPWIAIFDILITDTAQSGFYPVFLFNDDMTGFYLSLNQGVTEIKEKYKREAKQMLRLKAEDFRAQLGSLPSNFKLTEIKLKNNGISKSPLASLYEAGNILAKFYPAHKLPSNEELHTDILQILKIYETISYNEFSPTTKVEKENDEEKFKGFEELGKFRFHKRIERNIQLSKKVKEIQGFTCKACSLNFEEKYGELGKEFIEAHHLRPISQLKGERIQLDVRTDFTVLCSNCHSMIHRLDNPCDLDLLKSIINN